LCNPENKDKLLKKIDEDHQDDKFQRKNGEIKTKPFCNEHGINDVRFFVREVDEERKLPNHGGLNHFHTEFQKLKKQIEDRIDEVKPSALFDEAAKILSKEFKNYKNIYGKVIPIITVVVAIIVLLFGNNILGSFLKSKIATSFSEYWTNSSRDREKLIREEIMKILKDNKNGKPSPGRGQP
jgi:hypothetical protein